MDTLNQWYDEFKKTMKLPWTPFQAFQAGVSKSAVSMRERAMACCDGETDVNAIKNKIGALSDIP